MIAYAPLAPTDLADRRDAAREPPRDERRASLCLATSVAPYLALSAAIYLLLPESRLALVLAIPAAAFLVRSFIVFHDCSHGSFLASRRANLWLGRAIGLLLYSPFHRWRHDHAVHHATAGDLDRRGTGDLHTLTVAEYGALPPKARLGYRLQRNPRRGSSCTTRDVDASCASRRARISRCPSARGLIPQDIHV